MHNNSKIFRLFISSTFSDFQVERETLQTKIFPEIKEYCSGRGYTFQPIDLRWGVNREAQADQKTLEICIKEVQSCKRHDYPNFLIMLGDRYGWVPIPNIIEANEFELIIKNLNPEEKELLFNWYYEDKNQIPTSYILKQRTDEYIDYDKWLNIECTLRRIFQNAIENFDDTLRTKFITSATESEAIEGIISYLKRTEHQKQLLQLTPELDQLDHKHIFGFFRDIDKNSIIEDKFISDDYDKAQEFKNKIQRQLISENILHVNTSQVSKDKLNEKYLDAFTESILKFLKSQIEQQIKNNEEENYTNLELEKKQQYDHLNEKLENFLGQEKALDAIQNYINNGDTKPLIICGKSGIGKSSIMAKAIEDTSNTFSKKIIYRFIGATPNSKTTKDLLTSILEELNIKIENRQANEIANQLLTDIDKEENRFVEFSYKVYDEIINLKDDIIIFIDAVDQLSNDDQFLWLPNNLPPNVKIVISALKDENYTQDCKYFYILEDKISSYIEIEPFNKPIELLESLLFPQKRTLQEEQKEYFLGQYSQVNTPLYVHMAANQMQYWKGSDVVDADDVRLSITQKDIVKDYIENLTKLHHHNEQLVQKVFGYILASKDGLSEYEILELLNTDKEFIKTIAPDTWHTNSTQNLPLVIWTRFYNHIKPFLSRKNQDGQELLCFFHREFIDTTKNQIDQQKEHKNIIEATQKLIEKHQDQEFQSNRWGKLYAILLGEYFYKYEDETKVKRFLKVLDSIKNTNWLVFFVQYFQDLGWRLNTNNKFNKSITYRKITHNILDILNTRSNKWLYLYVQSSHNVASTLYRLEKVTEAIEIEEKNLKIVENISENNRLNSIEFMKYFNESFVKQIKNNDDLKALASIMWTDSYLKISSVLSSCYSKLNELEKAIELDKKSCNVSELLYNSPHNNGKFFVKHYLIALGNLANSHYENNELNEAIKLQEKALKIVEKEHDLYSGYLVEDYTRILNGLSVFLADTDFFKSNELAEKSQKIMSNLLNQNPDRFSEQSSNLSSNNLQNIHKKIISLLKDKDSENLKIYLEKIQKTLKEFVRSNDNDWISNESDNLFISFHHEYKKRNLEEAISYLLLNIRLLKAAYESNNDYWANDYVQRLVASGKYSQDYYAYEQALSLQLESYRICEKYFQIDSDNWGDLLTKTLNNLSGTFINLNRKKEAFNCSKMNLDISYKLFQKDQQKWFRAYYYALECMASTHSFNGDDENEKVCRDKIEELESNPLFQFEKDVIENKSADKKIKYFDYFYKALLLLGVYFFIKYVFLE